MNAQAANLNAVINQNNPAIFNLLSEKGRNIFFPEEGIPAQSAEAKGKRINATIGTAMENDGSPMRLNSIRKNILIDPKDAFLYAPSYGKPELRNEWLAQMKKKNPSLKGKTSLPVATNALTHALSIAGYLFVNPGDKIIIPDKFWGNYKLIFINGYAAELDAFNTFRGTGFDIEAFREKLNEYRGKKIVLLNFPNNPSGYSPTNTEAEKIIQIIRECADAGDEIAVICDDAYFGLVYREGIIKESLFSKLADLHKNVLAIKIDGPTKEDYVWGFRIGFITYASKGISEECCRALADKTAGAVRGNISNAPHISQSLVLNAIKSQEYEAEKNEKFNSLKARFEKVVEVLKDKKFADYFHAVPYNSGYFMCIELRMGIDAEKVRKLLLQKYDTGVISTGNILRIAYSGVAEKDIPELFENIYNACGEIGGNGHPCI